MEKEQALNIIEDSLKKMGCEDISFSYPKEDTIVAKFNCKEVTSFVSDLPGWTYSGIHLDPSKERQYQIEFKKNS